jgi:hypothetical protein
VAKTHREYGQFIKRTKLVATLGKLGKTSSTGFFFQEIHQKIISYPGNKIWDVIDFLFWLLPFFQNTFALVALTSVH